MHSCIFTFSFRSLAPQNGSENDLFLFRIFRLSVFIASEPSFTINEWLRCPWRRQFSVCDSVAISSFIPFYRNSNLIRALSLEWLLLQSRHIRSVANVAKSAHVKSTPGDESIFMVIGERVACSKMRAAGMFRQSRTFNAQLNRKTTTSSFVLCANLAEVNFSLQT